MQLLLKKLCVLKELLRSDEKPSSERVKALSRLLDDKMKCCSQSSKLQPRGIQPLGGPKHMTFRIVDKRRLLQEFSDRLAVTQVFLP